MYDPVIGRFPSLDPIADNFYHLSPYNYASNDPITNIDLWGLQGVPFRFIEKISTAAANRRIAKNFVNTTMPGAATSQSMQNVITQRNSIGSFASAKVGTQVSGAKLQIAAGNMMNASAGYTVGKVTTESSLSASGATNNTSGTALELGANMELGPLVDVSANASLGNVQIATDEDGNSSTESSLLDSSTSASIGGASSSNNGDYGFELSAFNVTVGASVNPTNLLFTVGNLFEAIGTFLSETLENAKHPERRRLPQYPYDEQ